MSLATPWHSSERWKPTEARRFIRSVNSGANVLIIETDAGLGYLKALGNPDGPHALVKEFVGTCLAASLGLPTFDHAVIEVTELDELPFFRGGFADPGPAFVTRNEDGSVWGSDTRLLDKIDNPEAISGLIVIDTWLLNSDRHDPQGRINLDNVFFSTESKTVGKLSLRVMDFSHAIRFGSELTKGVSAIDKIKDDGVYGLFPEFRKRVKQVDVQHFARVLGELPRERIEEVIDLIPRQWELNSVVRKALGRFLSERAQFVAETIEFKLFDPPQLTIDLSCGGET